MRQKPWIVVAVALFGGVVVAQSPQTTAQQNEEILKELRAIRQLLERMTPALPPPVTRPARMVRIERLDSDVLGNPNAPLTIVEFTDLQCPFCRQFATTVFEEIRTNWIKSGKLRYVSYDLPLDFHPQAMNAARANRCAGEQGRFWEARTSFLRNGHRLSPQVISTLAAELGLAQAPFADCLASSRYDETIRAQTTLASNLGITGTPTFVIGRTERGPGLSARWLWGSCHSVRSTGNSQHS